VFSPALLASRDSCQMLDCCALLVPQLFDHKLPSLPAPTRGSVTFAQLHLRPCVAYRNCRAESELEGSMTGSESASHPNSIPRPAPKMRGPLRPPLKSLRPFLETLNTDKAPIAARGAASTAFRERRSSDTVEEVALRSSGHLDLKPAPAAGLARQGIMKTAPRARMVC